MGKQSGDGQTKQIVGKTSSRHQKTDGKSEAAPMPGSPPHGLTNGEALAYSLGQKAATLKSYANPQFSTYSERIWYRAGWLDAKKQQGKLFLK